MIWTDEADDLLVRLFDEGGSYGYVAEGMAAAGYVVSRNAIAGRRFRLTPKRFHRATAVPIKTVPPKIIRPINQPRRRFRMADNAAIKQTLAEKDAETLRKWEGVDYLELTPDGCKAILDRPRGGEWLLHRVCGRLRGYDQNGSRSPYCAVHLRLYTNPQNRRMA